MRLRKGIIISAAVLSMMACTACGSSDKSKSATDAGNGTTGESSAIMVNAKDQSDENATVAGTEVKTDAGTETKAESDKQEESGTDAADNKDDAMENNTEDNYENYPEDENWDESDFSFDSILGIDQLDLNYEAHVAGFDGESFLYSVYIDDGVSDEKVEEIQQAVADFSSQSGDGENYIGYTDIQKGEDKIMIYHDLGGVSEENCNAAIAGLLTALNNVAGIKSVIINEDMAGFDY